MRKTFVLFLSISQTQIIMGTTYCAVLHSFFSRNESRVTATKLGTPP